MYRTRLREECDEDLAFGYDLMKPVGAIMIQRLRKITPLAALVLLERPHKEIP